MSLSVFPYPGGKTYLVPWLLDHIPQHRCYVEVFGGSASLLYNKPRSYNEVLNDLDGDIVQFFDVLRDRPEELREWLNTLPYAKDLHERFAGEFYAGERRDDPVERAGVFYYLRCTQFAGKYARESGFTSSTKNDEASRFVNKIDRIEEFSERLSGVTIENREWHVALERFDSPETFFYFDPPYIKEGDELYREGVGFDHDNFVSALKACTGQWLVSYTDIPDGLEDYHTVEYDFSQRMNMAHGEGRSTTRVERLVMNYNPDEEPAFAGLNQGLDTFF